MTPDEPLLSTCLDITSSCECVKLEHLNNANTFVCSVFNDEEDDQIILLFAGVFPESHELLDINLSSALLVLNLFFTSQLLALTLSFIYSVSCWM